MINAEVIRDLLRSESQQRVYVSGVIIIDGKEHHILQEVRCIKGEQHETFNDNKKFVRLIF